VYEWLKQGMRMNNKMNEMELKLHKLLEKNTLGEFSANQRRYWMIKINKVSKDKKKLKELKTNLNQLFGKLTVGEFSYSSTSTEVSTEQTFKISMGSAFAELGLDWNSIILAYRTLFGARPSLVAVKRFHIDN